MRKFTHIRVVAAVFAAGLIGTSAAFSFAAENPGSPATGPGMMHQDGGMKHGDMKGMMNMMGQMSQMMDQCGKMMSAGRDRGSKQQNDQKPAPSEQEKKG